MKTQELFVPLGMRDKGGTQAGQDLNRSRNRRLDNNLRIARENAVPHGLYEKDDHNIGFGGDARGYPEGNAFAMLLDSE